MNDTCISIQNVTKQYGKQKVLKHINLNIKKGEIFGLLGPSGAGKTTLVKEIAGLDIPTVGENYLFQEKMPSLKLIQRIGYMDTYVALYLSISVKETIQ